MITKKSNIVVTIEDLLGAFVDRNNAIPTNNLYDRLISYPAVLKFEELIFSRGVSREVREILEAYMTDTTTEMPDVGNAILAQLYKTYSHISDEVHPIKVFSKILEEKNLETPEPKLLAAVVEALETVAIGTIKYIHKRQGSRKNETNKTSTSEGPEWSDTINLLGPSRSYTSSGLP